MTDLEKSHLSKQCYRLIWDGQGLQSVERLLAEHSDVTPDVNKEISAEAELWLISYKLAIQKREQHLIKGLIGLIIFVCGLVLYFSVHSDHIIINLFRYAALFGGAYYAWQGFQAWRSPLEEKPFKAPDPEYIFRGFGQKKY